MARVCVCVCVAHLCVNQSVVEDDEPVDGEPSGVLQRQRFVAALADQPASGLPQRVLTAHDDTVQPCAGVMRHPKDPPWVLLQTHRHSLSGAYRHFAGEALPEV